MEERLGELTVLRAAGACSFLGLAEAAPQTGSAPTLSRMVHPSQVYRLRSSLKKSAPKERDNLAHGVSRGFEAPSLSPFPSPARAGEGCRRRGEGVRTQGSRPGLRYSAASRLWNGTPGTRDFINELRLEDSRVLHRIG